MREKRDCWSYYQNRTGSDSPKIALETEDHVPKTEHINPIKSCLIRDDLHMKAHLCSKGHLLTPALKGQEQSISSSGMPSMGTKTSSSWTRKFLPSRSSVTTRTTRFMLSHLLRCILRVQGGHHTSCLMVWWEGVPSGGDTSSALWERGETGAWVYQEDMLQGVVNPLNTTFFNGQECVFQQDSAPAHKAKMTQEWLRRNLLALISAEYWPSECPDLSPLDCKLWAVLKDMACLKHHNNPESLKRSLVKAPAEIPLETVHAVTAEWLEHLKACVEAEGGHFEWHYYKWKLKTITNKLFGLKSVCFV